MRDAPTITSCMSAAAGDLITNGHFENGASGWDVLADTSAGSVTWDTQALDDAKGCGKALHFVSAGSAGAETTFQVGQKIATVAGQSYTLSFRLRRVGDDDSQWMALGVPGTPLYRVDGRDDESWAAWGTFETMWTSAGDDTFSISVGSHGAGTGKTEWFFDSIEVLPL